MSTLPAWKWNQQIALVTGGGRGIGAATARRFAALGARVAVVARTSSEINQVKAEIEAAGGRSLAFAGDVSDEAFVKSTLQAVAAQWGRVTLLVNNAAMIEVKPLLEFSVQDWDRTMAVNLRAPFLWAREAIREMSKVGSGGAIVNLSSLGGLRGTEKFKGFAAYSTSKFGIVGLTECLAAEGREWGVRVNCVAPGAVDTRMLRQAAPNLRTSTTPDDVAKSIEFLCDGDRAAKISGAVIEIFSNE